MLKFNTYQTMFIIYGISLLTLILFASYLYTLEHKPSFLNICFINSKSAIPIIKISRGRGYHVMDSRGSDSDCCILGFFGVTHILLYMVLGYYVPKMFWETFFIGIIFEIVECYTLECHDSLDILWNTVGFLAGAYIHNSFIQKSI